MIAASTAEPQFPLAWPPWQPPGADGLAALVSPTASISWAHGLLARAADRLVVWAATGADRDPSTGPAKSERPALAKLEYPGVQAVTLTPARSDPRWVRLALEVALHLSAIRAPEGSAGACLTSGHRPDCPPGVVRIPHLVTVQRDNTVSDTVVWELAPVAVAQQWLGGPLPDPGFFECHLDSLLRLRAALRRGRLPARAVAAGIAEAVGDRDLSIRLVYEHAARFRALLSDAGGYRH